MSEELRILRLKQQATDIMDIVDSLSSIIYHFQLPLSIRTVPDFEHKNFEHVKKEVRVIEIN